MDGQRAAAFFRGRTPLPVSELTRRWEAWCSDHLGELPSGDEMWRTFWDSLGRELDLPAGVIGAIRSFDYFGLFRACPDAVHALGEARRLGLRIGVLSNSVLP